MSRCRGLRLRAPARPLSGELPSDPHMASRCRAPAKPSYRGPLSGPQTAGPCWTIIRRALSGPHTAGPYCTLIRQALRRQTLVRPSYGGPLPDPYRRPLPDPHTYRPDPYTADPCQTIKGGPLPGPQTTGPQTAGCCQALIRRACCNKVMFSLYGVQGEDRAAGGGQRSRGRLPPVSLTPWGKTGGGGRRRPVFVMDGY